MALTEAQMVAGEAVLSRESLGSTCFPARPRPRQGCCCIRPSVPPKHPDPAIYSQLEELSLGIGPTWDNPDIVTNLIRPWTILAEHSVTVRNLSSEVSAAGALVRYFVSPFGIGMPKTQIGGQTISLAPSEQKTLLYAIPAGVLSGALSGSQKIGTYVEIEHPTDGRLINNRGEQVLFGVFTSDSGRSLQFSFPVRNDSGSVRTISLTLLANALSATVSPVTHTFAPFEQIIATLNVGVPSGLHGSSGAELNEGVTVIAWAGATFVGGITHLVFVDN